MAQSSSPPLAGHRGAASSDTGSRQYPLFVAFEARVVVTLSAFVTLVLSAACSGGDTGGEGAGTAGAPGEMRLTLTDDDCTYEGDETPAARTFRVEVENKTVYFGAFALAAIAEGSTIDDLDPFLSKAQRQFERSGTLPDPPAFYSQVIRSGVDAGASSFLPADVPAGTYALMCFVDDPPTWRVHAAAQLDVPE